MQKFSSTETYIKSTQTRLESAGAKLKQLAYAIIYGASDTRIGYSFDPTLNDRKAKSKGKEIREAFVSAIDGLAELLAAIKKASAKGFIKSIDGRKILSRQSTQSFELLFAVRSRCGREKVDGNKRQKN